MRALSCRNYRLFFLGSLVSTIGTWIQIGAQSWLVLRLTDSGVAVGLLLALQFLPILVAGPWGGVVADRFDKRRVLLGTQVASIVLAGSLALVTFLGLAGVWMVLLVAFLRGVVLLVEDATYEAFVGELVEAENIVSAVALNGAISSVARIVGPAAAGVIILTGGEALCFLINAASYVAVVVSLLRMDTAELRKARPRATGKGAVRAGLRYAAGERELRKTLVAVAIVSAAAINFSVLLPIFARSALGAGPGSVGLLSSALGVGSLLGAVAVAGVVRPTLGMLAQAQAAMAVLLLGLAGAPSLRWAVCALVGVGAANITFLCVANSILQLHTAPEMRGRVMALYGLVFLGSTPVGALAAGWMAQSLGSRTAFALGAVLTLLAVPGPRRIDTKAP